MVMISRGKTETIPLGAPNHKNHLKTHWVKQEIHLNKNPSAISWQEKTDIEHWNYLNKVLTTVVCFQSETYFLKW